MGGAFKSSRNIKWVSNESWMKNLSEHPIHCVVYMMFLEGFWKVLGPTSLLKYLKFWVPRSLWGHSWYAALLAISGMLYDWFYYWLYLILVRLSLLNIKYLKSRVYVNTPCTWSNNNPGFSLWGLTINALTRIDEDISDIFWAAGIFLCLDQLLPDRHHCSGSLDLK